MRKLRRSRRHPFLAFAGRLTHAYLRLHTILFVHSLTERVHYQRTIALERMDKLKGLSKGGWHPPGESYYWRYYCEADSACRSLVLSRASEYDMAC